MQMVDKIVTWLREYAGQACAAGYVVGLSGGIDSATTAALCQRAVGANVLGVLMPCYSRPEDAEMARLAADAFGLETLTVDLAAAYDSMVASLPVQLSDMAEQTSNLVYEWRCSTLWLRRARTLWPAREMQAS